MVVILKAIVANSHLGKKCVLKKGIAKAQAQRLQTGKLQITEEGKKNGIGKRVCSAVEKKLLKGIGGSKTIISIFDLEMACDMLHKLGVKLQSKTR